MGPSVGAFLPIPVVASLDLRWFVVIISDFGSVAAWAWWGSPVVVIPDTKSVAV